MAQFRTSSSTTSTWLSLRVRELVGAGGTLPVSVPWREVTWVLLGELVGAIGAVASVRLLTGVMTPGTYGEFALGLTVALLVSQTALGPLAGAYARFFAPEREAGRAWVFFDAARQLTSGASALIAVLALLLVLVLSLSGASKWLLLAVGAMTFALLSGWETILDAIQNAARQRGIVAWHQGLRQWLRPGAAIVLLSAFVASSGMGLLAYALASLLVLGSQAWFFRATLRKMRLNRADGTGSSGLARQMLAYAAPFSVWGLFFWMQVSSDRWALLLLGSSQEVGLYAIVLQLGFYPLNLLGIIVTQLATPVVFARAGDGTDPVRTASACRLCAWLAVGMFGFTAVAATAASLLHGSIFALVVGPEYQAVSSLLPLAVVAGGVFNIGQFLALMPLALRDSRALFAPKVGTAMLALLLNFGGAYLFGIPGVVVANLLVAVCYTAWVAVTARWLLAARTQQSS